MADLLLLATMLLVCGGLGLPLANLLPASRFTWRLLIAPTLGFAVLGVAAPVAYQLGVAIPMFFVVVSAIAVIGLGASARSLVRAAKAMPPHERRVAVITLACWLAATAVLLLPRWVGGDQFSAFQGNHWDTYAYLQSALVYAKKPFSIVQNATDAQLVHNPLYVFAKLSLTNRPSAHMMYGVFSRVAPGQAYRLYYPYLIWFLSQFVLVAVFLLRAMLPKAPPPSWLAAAVVFPLGFWGQYVFDINAWSQLAATPVLFLMFGLLVHAMVVADPPGPPIRDQLRLAAVIGVTVAGGVYIYPEGFLVYVAAAVPIAGIVPVVRMVRARRFALRPLIPMLGLAAVATVVLFRPVLHHLIAQVSFASGKTMPWWEFFQAFFEGRDGVWTGGVDFLAGLFGLYFATPTEPTGALAFVERFAIVVTVVALLVGVVALMSSRAKPRDETLAGHARALIAAWAGVSVMLLAPAVLLARSGNYWPAGKVVSYAAPVFMTLLSLPLAVSFGHPLLRSVRWITAAFVAFQITMGVLRIGAAGREHGIHYAAPYPAVQLPALKEDFVFDLDGLEQLIKPGMRVQVDPMNPWPETHLMAFLYARGITFAKLTPMNTNFGAGADLGTAPPTWVPDLEISAERGAFVVRYRDGRFVRVVSGGDIR